MRVAFIHPDLGLGGAERLVVDAAVCLKGAGHQVTLFTAHHDPQRCFEETRDGTLDVRVYGQRLPLHVRGRLRAPCSVVRMAYLAAAVAVQHERFDVVVCDLVAHVIPLLRLITRSPVVFYCHFPDLLLTPPRHRAAYRAYRLPIDRLEAFGLRMADRVLVNSRFTAQRVRDVFSGHDLDAEVLHPAVDEARYTAVTAAPSTADEALPPTVLSLARYVESKNVGLAIRAFASLRQRLPKAAFDEWRLVVAGGYDERQPECRDTLHALRAEAQALGVADQVRFLVSVSDAERVRLLAQCRCVVYTPIGEHFGFVPLEAMASERPVIAVDDGGVRETVRHGETGLLCAPNAEAFADALASLIGDAPTARRMGQAGRRRVVEHFSQATFARRLEAILQEAVAGQTVEPVRC